MSERCSRCHRTVRNACSGYSGRGQGAGAVQDRLKDMIISGG